MEWVFWVAGFVTGIAVAGFMVFIALVLLMRVSVRKAEVDEPDAHERITWPAGRFH